MEEQEIGKQIRKIREAQGIKQTELAEKIGISKQLLYRYETGKLKHIPKETIEKIASVLHVLPSTIMGWDNTVRTAFMNTYDELDEEDQALAFKFILSLAANRKYDYTSLDKKGARNGSKETAIGEMESEGV